MGFWSNLFGTPNHEGVTPNENPDASVGGAGWNPGDPDGVQIDGEETFTRSLAAPMSSPWSGWPADWSTPNWQDGVSRLVDTAWDCIDLNASILSTMPVYRLRDGRSAFSLGWMKNPDPSIYTSWAEFAKQVFWDYQLGEVFILATDWYANGLPSQMRVIPPAFVKSEMDGGRRRHFIGSTDVTADILHIRYHSSSTSPRGIGPLEKAGARLTTAGVLQRQMDEVASTGGVPPYVLEVQRRLNKNEADELLDQWMDSRRRALGAPAITSGGTTAKAMQQPSPKDMALLELAQFTEARIAVKLGVPPFLVGLPSGGDSMTYSNVSSLFDFHDRASLKTKAVHVMQAISWWALPPGETVELNRDEYSRPALPDRATAYKTLWEMGALDPEEVRVMERLVGERSAGSLTGSDAMTPPQGGNSGE